VNNNNRPRNNPLVTVNSTTNNNNNRSYNRNNYDDDILPEYKEVDITSSIPTIINIPSSSSSSSCTNTENNNYHLPIYEECITNPMINIKNNKIIKYINKIYKCKL